ncbi:MAG: hypothetical protein Q4C82_04620 [Eubacteriales bacterium]|nr:hypothetical protein [Eubacteriales bacterium]
MEDTQINGTADVDSDTAVDADTPAVGDAAPDVALETEEPEETAGGASEETEETEEESEEEPAEAQPGYSLENPMPVYIVEPVEEETELEVMSLTGSYAGTISDTYLSYFRGIVQKLKSSEHYLVYRSGQYSYTMVYGEDVALSGSRFSGSGSVVTIYRDSSSYSSDWYVEYSEDSLSLDAGTLFVYSDLGMYPTLKEGGSALEFSALLFAVGFAVVYSVCHDIFDYIMEHVYRK